MSMLAEPRSRQKWSHDPRNTNWSNDKTKFGYQMLTKMGWSEGNGLGLNLTGNTSHISVNKRGSNAGVGLKKSHDDDWITHQDDFNALLSSLNGNPASESATPVEKMKASRHRYTKFVKSKDLSNASTDDMACIFGQRGKFKAEQDEEAEESDASESESDGKEELSVKTVESTLSMSEYFAKKMEALNKKKLFENSPICTSNISNGNSIDLSEVKTEGGVKTEDVTEDGCTIEKKKKKKKKKVESEESPAASATPSEEEVETSEQCKPKKKKKKKLKETSEEEITPSSCPETIDTCDVIKKKKKKKTKKNSDDESENVVPLPTVVEAEEDKTEDLVETTVKKKKKKRKLEEACPVVQVVTEENQADEGVKKKKKKKKRDV